MSCNNGPGLVCGEEPHILPALYPIDFQHFPCKYPHIVCTRPRSLIRTNVYVYILVMLACRIRSLGWPSAHTHTHEKRRRKWYSRQHKSNACTIHPWHHTYDAYERGTHKTYTYANACWLVGWLQTHVLCQNHLDSGAQCVESARHIISLINILVSFQTKVWRDFSPKSSIQIHYRRVRAAYNTDIDIT